MRRESDMTYPLGPLDNLKLFRMLVMHVALVFDAPLDPAKLRTSLTAVINEDGWKKLGARIRRKVRSYTNSPFIHKADLFSGHGAWNIISLRSLQKNGHLLAILTRCILSRDWTTQWDHVYRQQARAYLLPKRATDTCH